MIPVWQTRQGVETFGNCLEACVASILDVPLATVPDRAADVDLDAWTETLNRARRAGGPLGDVSLPAEVDAGHDRLLAWLADRGLAWLEIEIGKRDGWWLALADELDTHWIANLSWAGLPWNHATVWRGSRCVHNPDRGGTLRVDELGEMRIDSAVLLVASEPAKLARLNPLPDIAAEAARATTTTFGVTPSGVATTTSGRGMRMQSVR